MVGQTHRTEFAIIGSGMSGLCMAMRLKEEGWTDFVLLEKAEQLGGTWRENSYPGAACDVPSHLYSFSFCPNPNWTRVFSPQAEIQAYFEACADRYGVTDHIRFGTEVAEALYDEAGRRWRITCKDGSIFEARYLVSAVGQLSKPKMPDIKGLDTFAGESFHSAAWRHDVDLAGKRVGVIGNAASAVQFVPEIAKVVEHLTVFQRSANWIIPRPDKAYSKFGKWMFRHVPFARRFHRAMIYWLAEARFAAFKSGTWAGRRMRREAEKHLAAQVADPLMREKLTPDYDVGCKRILITDDYYPALQRDNVELVTDAIAAIDKTGVKTADGTHRDFDVLVFATGFEASEFLTPMKITGRGGQSLNDAWAGGAEAYRGVAVPGFPNFFMLYGPNTNLGHNSIIFMSEQEVNYILKAVSEAERKGVQTIEVTPEAAKDYNDDIQRDLQAMVWVTGCNSWYQNESGKVTNNWPHSTFAFWRMMRHFDKTAYHLG